eukprot:gene17563-23886_t
MRCPGSTADPIVDSAGPGDPERLFVPLSTDKGLPTIESAWRALFQNLEIGSFCAFAQVSIDRNSCRSSRVHAGVQLTTRSRPLIVNEEGEVAEAKTRDPQVVVQAAGVEAADEATKGKGRALRLDGPHLQIAMEAGQLVAEEEEVAEEQEGVEAGEAGFLGERPMSTGRVMDRDASTDKAPRGALFPSQDAGYATESFDMTDSMGRTIMEDSVDMDSDSTLGLTATYDPKPINKTALDHQSDVRFSSLDVSPLTKQAMAEVFGYEFCTKVQAQSLPACLSDSDVMAKAKTGTGKTVAFMIPVIEKLSRNPIPRGQVGAIVLSPTRELAMQIYTECNKLLKFHNLSCLALVGGTNINSEKNKLKSNPEILIATPGRLLDHLKTSGLEAKSKDLRIFVADEADSLLDMGFRPSLEKIFALLPSRQKRQTLLFSATFPQDVKSLADFALKSPYEMVDCVGKETGTNVQVTQFQAVVPHNRIITTLYCAMKDHIKEVPDAKIIVFFPTARGTQVMSEIFNAGGMPVLEMHSRKSQGARTRTSDSFRNTSGVIMFSSDVSARGVDYPDVSMVIQVGLPSEKAQYVHRVGRTARAGKAGTSLLLLADFEGDFIRKLSDLPVKPLPPHSAAAMKAASDVINSGLTRVSSDTKGKAYAGWLGFYRSTSPVSKLPKHELVALGNEYASILGCPEPPELSAMAVGKMGLKGVPGLNVKKGPSEQGRGGGGGGRGGGGGGRGSRY